MKTRMTVRKMGIVGTSMQRVRIEKMRRTKRMIKRMIKSLYRMMGDSKLLTKTTTMKTLSFEHPQRNEGSSNPMRSKLLRNGGTRKQVL